MPCSETFNHSQSHSLNYIKNKECKWRKLAEYCYPFWQEAVFSPVALVSGFHFLGVVRSPGLVTPDGLTTHRQHANPCTPGPEQRCSALSRHHLLSQECAHHAHVSSVSCLTCPMTGSSSKVQAGFNFYCYHGPAHVHSSTLPSKLWLHYAFKS